MSDLEKKELKNGVMKLSDDDLGEVIGGRTLQYTQGENVSVNNTLMNSSVKVNQSNLLFSESPESVVNHPKSGVPKSMIC